MYWCETSISYDKKMPSKLLVFGVVTITLMSIALESSAHYSTYEVYELYPQLLNKPHYQYHQQYRPQNNHPYQYVRPQQSQSTLYNRDPYYQRYQYLQQPQQQYYKQQRAYNQNPNVQVSVSEAEWVCTNPKTNDMMIIALDDTLGPRNNGPPQWHQVDPQNNQANNVVQPQPTFGNPTYPPVGQVYSTTEKIESPVWPNNNNYQPSQPQNNPTTETYTTTERGPGPIWSTGKDTTTKKTVTTTTPRTIGPIWSVGDGNKDNNNNGKKGFTVDDEPTTSVPFKNNPFFNPTQKPKTTTSATDFDDDEPIEIVLGR